MLPDFAITVLRVVAMVTVYIYGILALFFSIAQKRGRAMTAGVLLTAYLAATTALLCAGVLLWYSSRY